MTWKFILPKSPWWGGFYERLIRIVKECLKKTLGQAKVNYEEMETLLCEVEGAINSRPLTYLKDDPNESLTPAHLVIGRRLLSRIHGGNDGIHEMTMQEMNKRMTYLTVILSNWWKRFNTEYMNELRERHISQNRNKVRGAANVPIVGDVALIKDDAVMPRNKWKRGVIVKLIHGNDNLVRGALLKTIVSGKASFITRPVQRLIPLEIQRGQSESIDDTTAAGSSTADIHIALPNIEYSTSFEPSSTTPVDSSVDDVTAVFPTTGRPKRIAAMTGELKRRLTAQK